MAGAKQARFDVLVGDASNYLVSSGATAPHTQKDITGASTTIKWSMESLDVQATSSSATISYERLNTASQVKNFRMALVNIRLSFTAGAAFGSGDCIFAGRVVGQQVTHDRVVLTCEGLDTLAGKLPALGVVRFRLTGSGKSTNTVNVFNENGKPDRRGAVASNDLVMDDIEDTSSTTWGSFDLSVAMANQIHWLMGTNNGNGQTFQFDQVAGLAAGGADDKQRMDKTETKPAGIWETLQASAAESGYVVISAIDTSNTVTMGGQTFYGAMYPIAYDRQDSSKKKNITWNKYQTLAGGDLSQIPFPLQITHDNNTPTKLIGYSGRRMVMTCLEIDPSNTTYTETTTDEDNNPILRFHASGYNSTRMKIYASTKDRWDVLGDGSKWNRVGAVQPRIKNYAEIQTAANAGNLQAPVFVDKQEVIFKFAAGVFLPDGGNPIEQNPFSSSSELMVGSKHWIECRDEWADGLEYIEALDVKISQDSLDVIVAGFVENEDSAATGLTVENFKAMVTRMIIPVTITVDDREVALASQDARTWTRDQMFTASDVTANSDTPGFTYDHNQHQYRHQFYDQIVPVRRVDDLGEWSDGTKSFTPRIDGVEIDMQTILQKGAKNDLAASIYGDGSSMEVTIPIELYGLVAAGNFPIYFGDWLDTISAHAGVFAGYELPRPLMVAQQSFTPTEMRITYR